MELGGPLELAGACGKTDPGKEFEATVTLYKDKKVQSAKIQECKTIESSKANGSLASETGINKLLAALYNDYAMCVGVPFGTQNLALCPLEGGADVSKEDVHAFAAAICGLDTSLNTSLATGDVECVVPSVENLATSDAGGNTVWGGWIAVGPVFEEAVVSLPASNTEEGFAVKIEDLDADAQASGVFVAIKENAASSAATGGCPEILGAADSSFDCDGSSFTVDVDVPVPFDDEDDNGSPFLGNGLYVAMCEAAAFADVPGRCEGGQCAPGGEPDDDPLGLLDCSISTRSFKASTWAGMDKDPAARDIRVPITTQSNAGSEGVVVRLFGPALSQDGSFPSTNAVCENFIVLTSNTAECTFFDVPAADPGLDPGTALWYKVVAEKLVGTNSHSGQTIGFLAQDDPTLEQGFKNFPVNVVPQGQQ